MTDASKPYGDVQYADPGYQADKKKRYPIDTEAHCRAAWSYIHQAKNRTGYTAEQLKAIEGRIRAAGKKYGIEFSDTANRSATMFDDEKLPAPIEFRVSNVAGVNFAQRVIEVVAMPYNEEALVEYRSELWHESFAPGAFDGIEKRPNRVRANRDHDDRWTVGKVLKFWPSRAEGLVAEVRVAQTSLGDETLALADDDVLGASVGFAARGRDQIFDRKNRTRRVLRAFVDHLAFVGNPAYTGAGVLSVREGAQPPNAAGLPMLDTPDLDDLRDWLNARKQ